MSNTVLFDHLDAELQFSAVFEMSKRAFDALSSLSPDDKYFIENVVSDYAPEEQDEIRSHLELSASDDIEYARKTFANSVFLSSFGVFEFSLFQVLKNHLLAIGSSLSLSDLNGHAIEKFYTISQKLTKVKIHNELHWQYAKPLRTLRNKVAHTNGVLSSASDVSEVKNAISALEHTKRYGLPLGAASIGVIHGGELQVLVLNQRFVQWAGGTLRLLVRSSHETLSRAI